MVRPMTSVTFRRDHTIGSTTYEAGDVVTNLSDEEVRRLLVSSVVVYTARPKPAHQPNTVQATVVLAIESAFHDNGDGTVTVGDTH